MNRVLEDLTCGAIGYALGNRNGSKKGAAENLDLPLDVYIEKYATAHGVFTRSNSFARELMRIAENYKDSDLYD